MKGVYVGVVRFVGTVLRRTGATALLDAWAARSRTGRWFRSLLSIYDLDELVALDVPWWTFDAADLVDTHLSGRLGARAFEWGSGASTVWLSRRTVEVVAVEHDAGWAERVRLLVGATVHVLTVEPHPVRGGGRTRSHKRGFEDLDFTDYVDAIGRQSGLFDLIVIDGRAREACLRRALPHLAPDGLIVFDNVDRRRYRDAIESEPGLHVRVTRGLTPSLPYPTRTALIRRASPS